MQVQEAIDSERRRIRGLEDECPTAYLSERTWSRINQVIDSALVEPVGAGQGFKELLSARDGLIVSRPARCRVRWELQRHRMTCLLQAVHCCNGAWRVFVLDCSTSWSNGQAAATTYAYCGGLASDGPEHKRR